MLRILTYDIENDRLRTKAAKLLLRQGFERLQLSVFIGEIENEKWKALWIKLIEMTKNNLEPADQVCSFIIAPEQFRNLQHLGNPPDIDYLMDEQNVLYI